MNWLIPNAYAHPNDPLTSNEVIPPNIWWEWRLESGVLIVLCLLAFLYYQQIKRYQAEHPETAFPQGRFLVFLLGLGAVYGAIASPIDAIGEQYLFSMHMIQHNIFIYAVPWLLFFGIYPPLAEALYQKHTGFQKPLRFFTHPILACLIFNLMFSGWHYPYLYELALQDRMVHNLEHATFIVFSLLMWVPLWGPIRALRLSYGGQLLYIVGLTIAQIPIFAFLTFSKRVLYPTYELAPRLTFMSALADQQMGGVIMKITAMLVMSMAFIGLCREWYLSEKDKEKVNNRSLALENPVN